MPYKRRYSNAGRSKRYTRYPRTASFRTLTRRRLPSTTSGYISGVTGIRNIRASVGREVPLFAPRKSPMVEMHAFDSTLTAAFGTVTTGRVHHINDITQGTAVNQRTGSRLTMTALQMRGYVYMRENTSPRTTCSYQFMIIYDRAPTGTLPNYNEIMAGTRPISYQRLETRSRFTILYSKHDVIQWGVAGSPNSGSQRSYDLNIKLPNLQASFQQALSGLNSFTTGALYFINTSDAEPLETFPNAYLNFRTVFIP